MNLDCRSLTLDQIVAILLQRIVVLLARQAETPRQRMLIALAGVPGSGKTTISSGLMRRISSKDAKYISVMPMDGFHYSKAALARFPDPDQALCRRGAPFTYDADSFVELVTRLKEEPVTLVDEPETSIGAPSFDHGVQDPVADDVKISSRNKLVIIEGNYTLFDESPWNQVGEKVDERWFVDIAADVAKERLINRHLQAGIEKSRRLALIRVENNDLANADLIRSRLVEPDLTIIC